MGKKLVMSCSPSSSLKISKTTESKKVKQPPLNNLIELLRPKVYITDSSTFKTLVQQLTGNGSQQNTPTTTTIFPRDHDHPRMIHKGVGMEALFDSSPSSSPSLSSLSNQHEPSYIPTQVLYDDSQMMVNLDADVTKIMEQSSSSSLSSSPLSNISADDHDLLTIGDCCFDDLLAYDLYQHDDLNNHAPWLVGLADHVEPPSSSIPLVNSSVPSSPSPYVLEQDVSIYDYELTGFLV